MDADSTYGEKIKLAARSRPVGCQADMYRDKLYSRKAPASLAEPRALLKPHFSTPPSKTEGLLWAVPPETQGPRQWTCACMSASMGACKVDGSSHDLPS